MRKGYIVYRTSDVCVIAGEVTKLSETDNGIIHCTTTVNVWDKEQEAEVEKKIRLSFRDGDQDWAKTATAARKAKLSNGAFIIAAVKFTDAEETKCFVNRFSYPGRVLRVKGKKDDGTEFTTNIVSGYVNYVGRKEYDDRTAVYALMPDKAEGFDSATVYFSDKIAENAEKIFKREKGQRSQRGIFVCGEEKEKTWMGQDAAEHKGHTYTAYRFYVIRDPKPAETETTGDAE